MGGGEDVEVERGVVEIFLFGASGAAEAPEIEGEDAESGGGEDGRLFGPAFFEEIAQVMAAASRLNWWIHTSQAPRPAALAPG